MPVTVLVAKQPASPTEREELIKLFASSGFQVFKAMIAARCVERQSEVMRTLVYPDSERAVAEKEVNANEAVMFNDFLNFIDDFQKSEEQWYTVKLEALR